ncbi:unnamed protein product [Bursaphelenchus xylophilus]|uniref:(pine wood nematode) hypothetical protein n=1 Tax=Bursaphelenchus xylophilus TaxID=6326 RepID=A0A1I7SBV6_BURXY|nr:unnamed protein product [Bursaphelenchus xylophilus]CAG9112991.1 unnamed protein product [Bursaphelenchus xylophilus]
MLGNTVMSELADKFTALGKSSSLDKEKSKEPQSKFRPGSPEPPRKGSNSEPARKASGNEPLKKANDKKPVMVNNMGSNVPQPMKGVVMMGGTSMLGSNVLITGAESGIGFGMVEYLSKQFDVKHIFACCYNEKQCKELLEVAKDNPKIIVIEMDVLRDSSIQHALDRVVSVLHDGVLNLLINNAIIFEKSEGGTYLTPRRDVILKHLEVNTVGTMCVTSAFLPLIRAAAQREEPARVVNVSSPLGSIANNFGTMPWTDKNVAFGMSLAALNHLSRSIAGDERDTNVVYLNIAPGWIKASVCAPESQSPMEEAAVGVLKTIALTSRGDTGRYIDRNGTPINY